MQEKFFLIIGQASHSEKVILVQTEDLSKNMLHFLLEKRLPIASSCRGRGACHRCIVNDKSLLCQYSVKDFLQDCGSRVSISYL